jgi:methyltransferase (TIGR00027 family)
MVAAARWSGSRAEDALVRDPLAEVLVRAVGIDFFVRWGSGELTYADLDHSADEPWNTRRLVEYVSARTRYFDDFLVGAVGAKIRQTVILASGLDTRGHRLAWPPGTVVFDLDQPEVVAFKAATLAAHGAASSATVRAVPVDLRCDWPSALADAGFDSAQPTAWIAEGLLNFLPPDAQDRLLDDIAALSAPGSRLAAETFVGPTAADAAALHELMRHLVGPWREHGLDVDIAELADLGERRDAGEYLTASGWRTTPTTMNQLLAAYGRRQFPTADGRPSFGNSRFFWSAKPRASAG